jgi:hypothetical protein
MFVDVVVVVVVVVAAVVVVVRSEDCVFRSHHVDVTNMGGGIDGWIPPPHR